MPRFIYAGTRRDDPSVSDANPADHTVMFGIAFPRGAAVVVTDPHAVRKLTANHYFRVVGEGEGGGASAPLAAMPPPAPNPTPQGGGEPQSEPANALLADAAAAETDEAPRKGKRKGAAA